MLKIMLVIATFIICLNMIVFRIYCKIMSHRDPILKSEKLSQTSQEEIKESFLTKLGKFLGLPAFLRLNLFIVSYIPCHTIRNFFYKYIFMVKLAPGAIIHFGVEIRAPYHLVIGENSIIADHSILDARSGLTIGKNVQLSTGAWVWTLQHGVDNVDFSVHGEYGPVIIEDRAWVSCRTVILPGVKIHEGAVIAAGAVVTKDVEPFSINAGIPAKKIGERNQDISYELSDKKCYFL